MLFDRVISLIVGKSGGDGKELEGLRIAFSIEKGATETPNNSTVRIWNLSQTSRKNICAIGNAVILKAGYSQDAGAVTIFTGIITWAKTTREGADWVTELELNDGFMEFRDQKISVSYAPGISGLTVAKDIASKFGLTVRSFPSDLEDKQYVDGFSFAGRARYAMSKVCTYLGLEWSIQNNEVQVIKKGGVYRKQAIVLSSDTGLIGSPEAEQKTMTDKKAAESGSSKLKVEGYSAKSLLQPTMEPGGYVQLKSRDVNAEFFRIETVTHAGDTHGDDWHSELTLRYPK